MRAEERGSVLSTITERDVVEAFVRSRTEGRAPRIVGRCALPRAWEWALKLGVEIVEEGRVLVDLLGTARPPHPPVRFPDPHAHLLVDLFGEAIPPPRRSVSPPDWGIVAHLFPTPLLPWPLPPKGSPLPWAGSRREGLVHPPASPLAFLLWSGVARGSLRSQWLESLSRKGP